MNIAVEPRTAMCRQAIAATPFVAAGEGAAFGLDLPGGRRVPLRLHVADGWACLTVEVGGQLVRTGPWDALGLNASADGVARLILRPGDTTVALRADVPLAVDEDPKPLLAAACDDFRRLVSEIERGAVDSGIDGSVTTAPRAQAAASPGGHAGVDFAALLTESGWPFVQRAANRLAVDLGLPDWFQQAFITAGAGRRHRVRATVAVIESPTAPTRDAIGILLLTVSAVVRTVRGGRLDQDGESTLCFDAPLAEFPAASDVDAALGAVAMACQMAGREARTLIDERIARAYLAARGWVA